MPEDDEITPIVFCVDFTDGIVRDVVDDAYDSTVGGSDDRSAIGKEILERTAVIAGPARGLAISICPRGDRVASLEMTDFAAGL